MTAATITLNPGTGGAQVLSDTLTTVNGAAAPSSAQAQVAKVGFGSADALQMVDASNGLPIDPRDRTTTGTLAALNATVELEVRGMGACAVDLRGTFTGTVTFAGTIDGTNWFNVNVVSGAAGANWTAAVTATAPGNWIMPCAGFIRVRASMTAYTSGTATVVLRATPAPSFVFAVPISSTVTANIGTGSLAAGTNAIGDVGVQYRANATGAASMANVNCPATPAAQAVKASAGRLLGLVVTNTAASARWIKLWNTATGGITMGTTAALVEIGIPPGQTINWSSDGGIGFSTAISMAVTGGQGLSNNTAVTLGDVTGIAVFA